MKLIKKHTARSLTLVSLMAFIAASSITLSNPSSARATDSIEGPYASSDKKLSRLSLSYVLSFPTASTASFLGNSMSYRGVGLDFNEPTGLGDLYWGLSFRWLYFTHDEDQGSINTGNTTVTGRIYRSVDSFPITLQVKYPFTIAASNVFRPFIGLGIGTIYGRRELNIGAFSQNQYGWQFLMAPEVGTEIKFSPTSKVNGFFNVRYDAGFGSDAINAISNLSLGFGVASEFD